ncbi:hypothetical protein C1H57_25565, partial [Clostridium sp. 2-1]
WLKQSGVLVTEKMAEKFVPSVHTIRFLLTLWFYAATRRIFWLINLKPPRWTGMSEKNAGKVWKGSAFSM